MLLLADGTSCGEITATGGWSSATIAKWKRRFETDRLAGLWGRHKGSKPRLRTPQMEARVLNWTRKAPPSGATQWSTRSLAKHLKIPQSRFRRDEAAADQSIHEQFGQPLGVAHVGLSTRNDLMC